MTKISLSFFFFEDLILDGSTYKDCLFFKVYVVSLSLVLKTKQMKPLNADRLKYFAVCKACFLTFYVAA